MLLKYVVTIMVDDSFVCAIMYSNLAFLAQPSNNARLLRMTYKMTNQLTPCQAK